MADRQTDRQTVTVREQGNEGNEGKDGKGREYNIVYVCIPPPGRALTPIRCWVPLGCTTPLSLSLSLSPLHESPEPIFSFLCLKTYTPVPMSVPQYALQGKNRTYIDDWHSGYQRGGDEWLNRIFSNRYFKKKTQNDRVST